MIGQFKTPEPLGGYLAMGHSKRQASAIANTAARLLYVPMNDLYDVMDDHFDAARTITAYQLSWVEQLRLDASNAGGPDVS